MNIHHFVVPSEAYPRYEYSRKHVLPLLERYRILLEQLSLKDNYPVPTFDDVNIYVIRDESSITIKKEDLASKSTDKIKFSQLSFPLDEERNETHGVDIYVATYKQTLKNEDILAYTGKYVILLYEEDKGIVYQSCRGKEDVMLYSTTVANLPGILINLLERVVFRSLLERVKVLQCILELEEPSGLFATLDSDTKSSFKQITEIGSIRQTPTSDFCTLFRCWWTARFKAVKRIVLSQYSKTSQEFTESLIDQLLQYKEDKVKYPESQIREAILPVLNFDLEKFAASYTPENLRADVKEMKTAYYFNRKSDELIESFTKHAKLAFTQMDTAEELHGEIQGMYYRSKIPVYDRPSETVGMSETLDEKVARKILKINGVTGVGYRFRILDIILKDTLTEVERIESEEALRVLCEQETITKYLFRTEREHISPLTEVGSSITVKRSGTLGGFALLGNQRDLCVLLARHLANQGVQLYLQSTTNSNDKSVFAHVLEPKIAVESVGSLDIALAKVLKKCKNDCKVQFKDEEGHYRASHVCRYDDTKWLSGLPVHIWGATSSPGLGKIVIPVLYMKDMEEQLMMIEDRGSVDRKVSVEVFAKEGDSGAVVSANDPDEETVFILAMLIGSSHNPERASKGENKRYVSFRLINGLKQLEKEQNETIELC